MSTVRRISLALFVTMYISLHWLSFGRQESDFVHTAISFQPDSNTKFSWGKIAPSDTLEWSSCFDKLLCARLNVPLNYSEAKGRKAVLAMICFPSPFAKDPYVYKGPVLFNPGGPGGSGVDFVRSEAIRDMFRETVGPGFDLVSFDPRGVGLSTPRASFFKTEVDRQLWKGHDLSNLLPFIRNSTEHDFAHSWAKAQIIGELVKENNDDDFLQHINTENTARDMLHINGLYGREKVMYWGLSYGTILGATFASLFPDKVDRLLIDGVADPEDYYSGQWNNNLINTEKAMRSFYDSCSAAGPSLCSFWADSPSMVRAG